MTPDDRPDRNRGYTREQLSSTRDEVARLHNDVDGIEADIDELKESVREVKSRLEIQSEQLKIHEKNDDGRQQVLLTTADQRHAALVSKIDHLEERTFKLVMVLLAAVLALAGVNLGVDFIKPAEAVQASP